MKQLLTGSRTEEGIANQMNIREQLAHLEAHPINGIELFYDWFCSAKALPNKAANLLVKVKRIVDSPRFDANHHYVFLKNNCPMVGLLYDDFRICSISTGEVQFCVVPKSGNKVNAGKTQVFGRENKFKEPLFEGSWADAVLWFNHPGQALMKQAEAAAQKADAERREQAAEILDLYCALLGLKDF